MNAVSIRNAAVMAVIGVSAGCFRPPQVIPPPDVNFAAHVDHRGLIIDRMRGNEQARLVSACTFPFRKGPQFLLNEGGSTTAAVWRSNGHLIVRAAPDPGATILGEVHAAWDDREALRLSVESADGQIFAISRFNRVDSHVVADAIGEPATMTFDARGVYRADVRDANGTLIGWLRVRVAPRGSAVTRTYEGDLPPGLNGPLAVAVVAEVDSQITAMRRNAVNPYLGS